MAENYFTKLAAIDCGKHIEKKNNFSYLSWPFAVAKLRETDPAATWEVVRFNGLPFLATECGYFVEVAVTVQGVRLSQIHPVIDHRNQPIAKPSAYQINTSLQRCLVKAIALHGLGLYIYAGEDLPGAVAYDDTPQKPDPQAQALLEAAAKKGTEELRHCWKKQLTEDQRVSCEGILPELKVRAAAVVLPPRHADDPGDKAVAHWIAKFGALNTVSEVDDELDEAALDLKTRFPHRPGLMEQVRAGAESRKGAILDARQIA